MESILQKGQRFCYPWTFMEVGERKLSLWLSSSLLFSASDQPLEQLVPGGYQCSYSQQLQESFGEEKKASDGLLQRLMSTSPMAARDCWYWWCLKIWMIDCTRYVPGMYRLYFLKQLKRAGLSSNQLLHYYTSVKWPVLEISAPVWHYDLTKEQTHQIEKKYKNVPFTSSSTFLVVCRTLPCYILQTWTLWPVAEMISLKNSF